MVELHDARYISHTYDEVTYNTEHRYRFVLSFGQAWTLGLLARCHFVAGEAVTAEGLFRAALDGLGGVGEESQNGGIVGGQRSGGASMAVVVASPIHPYSKAATLRGYSELLTEWEKREAEGDTVTQRAESVSFWLLLCSIERVCACKALRFDFFFCPRGRLVVPLH